MSQILLEVENLKTVFNTDDGVVPAVDGVDFTLNRGETLAIVGESGCGKSVTALSIIGLVPNPPGRVKAGRILFKGKDLLALPEFEIKKIRGNDIAMIFQEPMTSLNPLFTVGWQIQEAICLHQNVTKNQARQKAIEMLNIVGIPSAEKRINDYPHQMSGGMRQRVMIAMALSCRPDLLIADEPTTALDVTIQAQILDLIAKLKKEFGTAILLITHDLGVVAEVAEKVLVMYCGKVVEYADIDTFLDAPKHPYSIGLIDSIPRLYEDLDTLRSIEGMVPDFKDLTAGCVFYPRCRQSQSRCMDKRPPLIRVQSGHNVSCWLYSDL